MLTESDLFTLIITFIIPCRSLRDKLKNSSCDGEDQNTNNDNDATCKLLISLLIYHNIEDINMSYSYTI